MYGIRSKGGLENCTGHRGSGNPIADDGREQGMRHESGRLSTLSCTHMACDFLAVSTTSSRAPIRSLQVPRWRKLGSLNAVRTALPDPRSTDISAWGASSTSRFPPSHMRLHSSHHWSRDWNPSAFFQKQRLCARPAKATRVVPAAASHLSLPSSPCSNRNCAASALRDEPCVDGPSCTRKRSASPRSRRERAAAHLRRCRFRRANVLNRVAARRHARKRSTVAKAGKPAYLLPTGRTLDRSAAVEAAAGKDQCLTQISLPTEVRRGRT